jgi:hypothetical protein
MEIEMKFLFRVLIVLAIEAFSYPVFAGSFEVENKGENTTVRAVIEPSGAKSGKALNVWISAVYNGVPYFYNGSSWVAYSNGPLPVAVKGKVLAASNTLTLAKGTDLSSLPGAELYVGYGTTEEDMMSSEGKMTKVGKIGKKLRWPAPRAQ